jgi:hypothetical protein
MGVRVGTSRTWEALPLCTSEKEQIVRSTYRADIDDWVFQFERIAVTRLKEIFEKDLDGTPTKIIERLERLRRAEEQRMKNEPT